AAASLTPAAQAEIAPLESNTRQAILIRRQGSTFEIIPPGQAPGSAHMARVSSVTAVPEAVARLSKKMLTPSTKQVEIIIEGLNNDDARALAYTAALHMQETGQAMPPILSYPARTSTSDLASFLNSPRPIADIHISEPLIERLPNGSSSVKL